jgi:uncharacterized metal-binding protein
MPGYRTHDTIAVIAAPVLTAGTFALLTIHNHEPATSAAQGAAILTTTHLLCSYFMSPDLDIRSAIAPRWGPFAVLWKPYEIAIPHRSWLSHSGLSALLRLIYIALIASIIASAAGIISGWRDTGFWLYATANSYPRETMLILAGAIIADMLHVAADWFTSEIRHYTGILTMIGILACAYYYY